MSKLGINISLLLQKKKNITVVLEMCKDVKIANTMYLPTAISLKGK